MSELEKALNMSYAIHSVRSLYKLMSDGYWEMDSVLQIRDFQLASQWAEGLKGILKPQLVQESCIFLLPRSTKIGENKCWFILYHVYISYSHEK